MTYAKLLNIKSKNGVSELYLSNDDMIIVRGSNIQFNQNMDVCYNKSLHMKQEDWLIAQPILSQLDFAPLLNQQLKMSYDELANLPQWAWKGAISRNILYAYSPINLMRSTENADCLYGLFRELDFPSNGMMTLWRPSVNMKSLSCSVESEVCHNQYYN